MTTVVQEMPEHFGSIRRLTIDAFAASNFGHNGEAELIDSIRNQCDNILSLVAIDDHCVVGHILFSPTTIRSKSSTIYGMGLAPMAVLPSYQKRGVGSMLVREGLQHLTKSDSAFTIVAGHPEYYLRFGFLPAQRFSITHGFADMPQDILFIHLPDETLISELTGGLVYYHSSFGPQHDE
ncbi:MAG: N-acetyltransferase [Symploca sp. SIO2G7]|nr:N-acetyltransferase [Symploca sp. SIO2G7]